MAANRDKVAVVVGGLLGGALVGYIHVFVLAYVAFVVSIGGFKYIGQWAFFLNGTASALLSGIVVGLPLVLLLPRLALSLALVIGLAAAAVLVYLGVATTEGEFWWIAWTDAVQVPIFLILSVWLGGQLPIFQNAHT